MSNHLLPPNATAQERALSEAIARISDVPILVRKSWDPDTCPTELLPWLAWAFSVDEWQPSWTEQEKRDVIKASLDVHRHKGTPGSLAKALAPLGYGVEVREWWQMTPPGEPYTFEVTLVATDKPVTPESYERAEHTALQYKNLRSHLTRVSAVSEQRTTIRLAATTASGDDCTVWPYSPPPVKLEAVLLAMASACQDAVTTSIFPVGYVAGENYRITEDGQPRITTDGQLRFVA
ncbi:phage tail protein I [Pseudomonas carassii]|uniref:Phage tail protein I n=1 Tax=Pseudomonas carassii TaxID=3115855 RepID=A0ABU7H4H8_9PSED|nr:phage tail protein I [Pseudomonas sp. 137P]MEE1886224.1 phage tail protein I [Pseudomonas sp. 137P]